MPPAWITLHPHCLFTGRGEGEARSFLTRIDSLAHFMLQPHRHLLHWSRQWQQTGGWGICAAECSCQKDKSHIPAMCSGLLSPSLLAGGFCCTSPKWTFPSSFYVGSSRQLELKVFNSHRNKFKVTLLSLSCVGPSHRWGCVWLCWLLSQHYL